MARPEDIWCDAHVFPYESEGWARVFIVSSNVHDHGVFIVLDVRVPGVSGIEIATQAAVVANDMVLGYELAHDGGYGQPARVYVHLADRAPYDSAVYLGDVLAWHKRSEPSA